jgi:hypothetical protein
MRFSLVARAVLAAFGEHLGAHARASPNELAASSPLYIRNDASLSVLEDVKRRLVSMLPRAPLVAPLKPQVTVKSPPARPDPGDPVDGPPLAAKPVPGGDGLML